MPNVVLQNVYKNGHTYLLVDQGSPITWAGTEAQAAGFGGPLVTINDAAEQEFVYSAFSDVGFGAANDRAVAVWFFMGLNGVETEGTFAWVTGEAPAYTNCYTGQPASTFDFIGWKWFSDKAGQLRNEVSDGAGTRGDCILVEGDANGDGRADFRFQVDNFLSLT